MFFCLISWWRFLFFFFQAEDGIRDYKVTGVQTCALPISCIRCASTPQPDCTATYCTPSTAKELGTPVMPELVLYSQTFAPVLASKARKARSLVPPMKTSPPPVVRIGPQSPSRKVCAHTFWPVAMSHACSSPMCDVPWRWLIEVFGRSIPRNSLPGSCDPAWPTSVLQRFSLA